MIAESYTTPLQRLKRDRVASAKMKRQIELSIGKKGLMVWVGTPQMGCHYLEWP